MRHKVHQTFAGISTSNSWRTWSSDQATLTFLRMLGCAAEHIQFALECARKKHCAFSFALFHHEVSIINHPSHPCVEAAPQPIPSTFTLVEQPREIHREWSERRRFLKKKMRSPVPLKEAVLPSNTTLAYKFLRMSTSHFVRRKVTWIPLAPYRQRMLNENVRHKNDDVSDWELTGLLLVSTISNFNKFSARQVAAVAAKQHVVVATKRT